jgi:ATP-dependent helicase/nuclease subunit B
MTACKYCIYSSVCQFDTAMRGNRYRYLADLDDAEIWNRIGEQKTVEQDTAAREATRQEDL